MVFFLANYWKIYFYWKKRWAFELGVPGDNHILYIFSREFSLISLVSLFYLLFDLWCTCFITKTEVLFFLSLCSRSWFLGENFLSQLSRFTFLFTLLFTFLCTRCCCCSPGELLGGGWVASSTTGVSDVLATVEREERNVRLGENSVIGTSVEGRNTSSSFPFSGKNVGYKRPVENS